VASTRDARFDVEKNVPRVSARTGAWRERGSSYRDGESQFVNRESGGRKGEAQVAKEVARAGDRVVRRGCKPKPAFRTRIGSTLTLGNDVRIGVLVFVGLKDVLYRARL